MSELVPAADIERIVGAVRHQTRHMARAVSSEQTVYILHSEECRTMFVDLRDCPFSLALDGGIRLSRWDGAEDRAVWVRIDDGELEPLLREDEGR